MFALQGETPQEMAGLAEAMQTKAVPVHTSCDGMSGPSLPPPTTPPLHIMCIAILSPDILASTPMLYGGTDLQQQTLHTHHVSCNRLSLFLLAAAAAATITAAATAAWCVSAVQCWTLWELAGMALGQ